MNFARILCVDDNPSLLQTLKMSLEPYGVEVITASQGMDALVQYQARAREFSAIVTDHDMPQMNGLEFVHCVREMGFKGRIVVMSGRLNEEDLRAYHDYAVSGFFHKPFEMSLLATMLLHAD